jgi:hypothetical protein
LDIWCIQLVVLYETYHYARSLEHNVRERDVNFPLAPWASNWLVYSCSLTCHVPKALHVEIYKCALVGRQHPVGSTLKSVCLVRNSKRCEVHRTGTSVWITDIKCRVLVSWMRRPVAGCNGCSKSLEHIYQTTRSHTPEDCKIIITTNIPVLCWTLHKFILYPDYGRNNYLETMKPDSQIKRQHVLENINFYVIVQVITAVIMKINVF